jgi:predicted glycosyltransferase
MNLPRIVIHCQYVYGLGHLVRALNLAKGLVEYYDVYFLNGGEAVDNLKVDSSINFIQLPAIYKEEGRSELSSVSNDLSLTDCFKLRGQIIREKIEVIAPEIVITEHFPFGLLFSKEVIRLIDYAKRANSKAKIVCSVRDVIESLKGGDSDQETVELLASFYDLVLIHGTEEIIPIESSFPLAKKIKPKIVYTGYVVDPMLHSGRKRSENILVSVGGGRVGGELLTAVVNAFKQIKTESNHKLVVFKGAFDSRNEEVLEDDRVEYFSFDRNMFLNQLSISDISISLGGYNSTVESIYAGNEVIIYNRKFLGSNEEQNIRISRFKEAGLISVISLEDLEVSRLSKILLSHINNRSEKNSNFEVDFKGIDSTVSEIKELIDAE